MSSEHSAEWLFHAALEVPLGEREAFVRQACGPDSAQADFVWRMLAAHQEMEEREDLRAGERVGPYVVTALLGRGGMGAVYLAEEPGLRQVALKVIRRDRYQDLMVPRFVMEQRALAQLSHPNIATLYSVGLTADGRPFFSMEYVDGVDIETWAGQQDLTIEQRLRSFRDVCAAVQCVHSHSVIHRDIKTSNVMVTGAGQVKLLDFGLAKSLAGGSQGETTILAWRTPETSSPEQLRQATLTTATDVYSLGVLLYRLLTGELPFPRGGRTDRELERAVLEDDPERPSALVRRLVAAAAMPALGVSEAGAADRRPLLSEAWARRLQGDLDNIVLKALQKEPTRRYATPHQFSEDIGRHLDHAPIIARQPTWRYRAGKFVRRYRTPVAAATLLVAGLGVASVAVAWQAQIARTERSRAERRFNDVRQLANSFIFELDEKIVNVSGAVAARELMVTRALEYLDSLAQEASDPDLVGELATAYERVGDVQGNPYEQSLGRPADALTSYERSRELRARLPMTSANRHYLAGSYLKIGDIRWVQRRWAAARESYNQARLLDEAAVGEHADPAEVRGHLSIVYTGLGDTAIEEDQLLDAERAHGQSLAIRSQLAAAEATPRRRRNLAVGYVKLADVKDRRGDYPGAIEQFREALRIFDELTAADPDNEEYRSNQTATLNRLGLAQQKQGETAGAIASQRRALGLALAAVNAEASNATARRNLASTHSLLGDALLEADQVTEAIAHLREHLAGQEALASQSETNEQTRRDVWIAWYQLGKALLKQGRLSEALRYLQGSLDRAVQLAEQLPGDARATDDLVDARIAMARALRADRRVVAALDQLREAEEPATTLVELHPAMRDYRSRLATYFTELALTHDAAARQEPTRASAHRSSARAAWQRGAEVYAALLKSGTITDRQRRQLAEVMSHLPAGAS